MTTKTARKAPNPALPNGSDSLSSQRWFWTADEFQRAYDLGLFGDNARLELIEGEIIKKMPQNERHTWAIRAVEEALRRTFVTRHDVRVQMPLVFGPHNKPEPDVTVVLGTFNDYKRAHPTTAVLIVEVPDSTLENDRTTKAAVYARAGIPEYWIVNLPDRVVEIYREPAAMASQPLGHHYRSITRFMPGDVIAPLTVPDAALPVSGLLP